MNDEGVRTAITLVAVALPQANQVLAGRLTPHPEALQYTSELISTFDVDEAASALAFLAGYAATLLLGVKNNDMTQAQASINRMQEYVQ